MRDPIRRAIAVPVPTLRSRGGPAGELVVWEHAGSAPATLLLHGIGNYGRYWDLVARETAGRLRLIAPDARGHGDSAKPRDGYAPDDFVGDAIGLMDALSLERVVLVGHSMGGSHAILLARRHPERVSRLVVVDTSAEPLPEGHERAVRLSLGRPATFPDEAAAERYLRATSPGYTDEVYRDRLEWVFRRSASGLEWRSSQDALRRILNGAQTRPDSLWAALAELSAPVLLVRGTRSNVLSAEIARRMVAAITDARLLELDAGHNVPLDRPRELADAVVSFAREATA